jgi:hypothetical protein
MGQGIIESRFSLGLDDAVEAFETAAAPSLAIKVVLDLE